ncbi:unnamed protein product [Lampetra fluviatilis]
MDERIVRRARWSAVSCEHQDIVTPVLRPVRRVLCVAAHSSAPPLLPVRRCAKRHLPCRAILLKKIFADSN